MNFKIGFKRNKFRYGWYRNELYRLPDCVGGCNYSLKKLDQIHLSDTIIGYRIETAKLSMAQIAELNERVDWSLTRVTGKDFNLIK